MTRSSAPRRDFAAMQARRRRAARLFAAGKRSQAEIARELDISRQSVSRWYAAWRQDKPNWIRGAGRAGRRPQLDKAQLKQVDKALRQGAQAHGFATALWTLPRVAAVIEQVTGVLYHPGHVWKILAAMEWSLQRPAKQARERNEEGRREWMAKRWPAIKKRPAAKSLDSLPGRKRSLRAAAGKTDLGSEGRNSGVGLCLQLEKVIDQRGTRLSLGRQAIQTVVSDPVRKLQRPTSDCLRARFEEAPARAKGDSDLGWIACAQEPEDEAVSGKPAWLAASGNAAGLLSRPESGRGLMEQHQRTGTCQPLCCRTRRGRRGRVERYESSAQIHAAIFFPAPRGTLFLIRSVTVLRGVQ